jgi:hypothetical protein
MRLAALVSASVFSSVMVPGCVTSYDGDPNQQAFEEEAIGSSQQALVTDELKKGDWTICNCTLGLSGLTNYVRDDSRGNAIWKMCQKLGTTTRIPIIVTNVSRKLFNANGTPLYPDGSDLRARMWFAAFPNSVATATFNNVGSCSSPYIHRFWTNGWKTDVDCKAAGKTYYDDMILSSRGAECAWTKLQTGFMSAAASVGKGVLANCNNLVGFDPLATGGSLGCGWLC